MNNIDKAYTALLQDILDNGVTKQDRTGTGTISVFGRQIRHKMSEGFPLLTTKKLHWKSIVTELLWFLRGDTHIKFLHDNNCHIWDGDLYKAFGKWYNKHSGKEGYTGYYVPTKEEFIRLIKTDDEFASKWGELGPIYGKQWRKWKSYNHAEAYFGIGIDQIANLISELKTNPDSRRLMVNAWNVGELDQMVLPPCHYGFQVYTRELSREERWDLYSNRYAQMKPYKFQKMLDGIWVESTEEEDMFEYDVFRIPKRAISLMCNQRSVDTFLGLPFNIASYGLLLEIIAKEVNMVPDELIGNLGDVHLYSNHIEQAKEQIGREYTEDERIEFLQKTGMDALVDGKRQEFMEANIPKRTRQPFELPTLKHMKTDEFYKSLSENQSLYGHLDPKDFQLENYQSHPAIKAPLSN
jgi:thymidylate synthase